MSTQKLRPFQTMSSSVVWSCPWYEVRRDNIRLPDGQMGAYHVVQHPGAVWVVPVTVGGRLILLHHFRYTVDDWCWELPAGGLKAGQQPLEAAKLELREEVGGVAKSWEKVGQFYTSNGISNEVAHVFLAHGVTLGQTSHEPAEVMEVHTRPVPVALAMARNNEISDGPSALALLLTTDKLAPYL